MKKSLLAAVFAVLILSLAGCLPQQDSSTTSDAGFQTAFDNSVAASDFTDELLEDMLGQKGINNYEIELTSGGFITHDPVTYLVGYRYRCNDEIEVYGYKLRQTEDGFTVLDEGPEVGAFIVGNGD